MPAIKQTKIIEVFGDFTPYLNDEGVPTIFWEEEILTQIVLPAPLPLAWDHKTSVSRIKCHKKIASFLMSALNSIHEYSDVWATINDYGGCYSFRMQRKATDKLSRHCWAIAIDLDVGDNPFGNIPKVHPKVVEIFDAYGFMWGGLFPISRRDGMHFEFTALDKIA